MRDSNFPEVGMTHKDVRKRVRRISSTREGDKNLQGRIIKSLINQAELNQKGAGKDIAKELDTDFRGTRSMNCSGSKQAVSISFCKRCHYVKEHCKCEKKA